MRGTYGLVAGLIASVAAGTVWAANPCGECHEEPVTAVARTVHARVAAADAAFCVACHGDPSAHLASGEAKDIRGQQELAGWGAGEQAAACLSCHQASRPAWGQSTHARANVSCWSCHGNVWHRASGKAAGDPAACASCHGKEQGEFRRAWHHPVPEEQMGCASCHDPHGPQPEEELARERCASCHPQAAGPFVFPHRAVEEEGCTACHAPHGSVNRSLLRTSGNGLCVRCHIQSNFPGVGKVPHNFNLAGGGRCFDCHSEVHGSNVNDRLAPRLER
ncbi:MAG: cytochrome c3 family protein [Thermoanaerobaculum sp.]